MTELATPQMIIGEKDASAEVNLRYDSLTEKVLSDKQLPHLISRAMISSLKGSVAAIITETALSLLHIPPHIRIPIVTLAGLTPPIWEHTKWYLIDRTRILNPEEKGT